MGGVATVYKRPMLDKFAVARALRELGALLELEGENPFKVRAYENGARAVEALATTSPLAPRRAGSPRCRASARRSRRRSPSCTGPAGSSCSTGCGRSTRPASSSCSRSRSSARRRSPRCTRRSGSATSPSSRRPAATAACAGVKGFGERTEAEDPRGDAAPARARGRAARPPRRRARGGGARSSRTCAASPAALRGRARRAPCGGGRRRSATSTSSPRRATRPRSRRGSSRTRSSRETIARGDTKTSVRLASGLQVDLRVVPPEDFPTLLHHFTGSKAHHVRLRGLARERGFTLSEWGLHRLLAARSAPRPPDGRCAAGPAAKVPIESEDALYAALGLPLRPARAARGPGRDRGGAGRRAAGRTSSGSRTCAASSTATRPGRTAAPRSRRWPAPPTRSGSSTSPSPITRRPRRTRAGSTSIGCGGSGTRSRACRSRVTVRLLRGTESDILEDGALDFPDACSSSSTSSSRACTRA